MSCLKWVVAILLVLTVFVAQSGDDVQSYRSGEWAVSTVPGYAQIAHTRNEAGATTGILCGVSNKLCLAYIVIENSCVEGQATAMLINSPVGVLPITTTCSRFPGVEKGSPRDTMNVITEFDAAKQAFESGGIVGFAYALSNGEFKVIRFSTAGATAAIKAAMTLQNVPSQNPSQANRPSEETL